MCTISRVSFVRNVMKAAKEDRLDKVGLSEFQS